MKSRAALIVLLMLALAGVGLYLWRSTLQQETALTISGNVDIREVTLSFRVGGRVSSIEVEEGDRVGQGDLIAKVDQAPLEAVHDQAVGSFAGAKANLDLLKAGAREEDLARLRAQVDGRRAALANARSTFERQETLVSTQTSSRQVRDNAQAAFDQATAELAAAEQELLAAEHGPRPEEIAQAQAQVTSADAQRRTAEIQLEDSSLISPSVGTVLTRAVEPGTIVSAGTGIVTLSLDRPVRVRAYVQQHDLGRVAPGTKVLVYSDARPEPFSGVVGFVAPRAEFTPKQVETQDLRTALVYRLRITVEDAQENLLRQGMPVTVRLADEPR